MTAHPCPFPRAVLELLDRQLPSTGVVLDPFAGIGRVHELATATRRTIGVEIEAEWAATHPRTLHGDATALPFPDAFFDAVATSPAYGNRMADSYDGRDGSRRHTYRLSLGRPLSIGSGAGLQWGESYRDLHRRAVAEMVRVARPGAVILVNAKDHVRAGEVQHVVEWWATTLEMTGATHERTVEVDSGGLRHGANRQPRPEVVLVHRKAGGR